MAEVGSWSSMTSIHELELEINCTCSTCAQWSLRFRVHLAFEPLFIVHAAEWHKQGVGERSSLYIIWVWLSSPKLMLITWLSGCVLELLAMVRRSNQTIRTAAREFEWTTCGTMSELQQISQWMEGLTHCGLYYEGYTDVQQMLTIHSTTTVTTYGVRRSHINHTVTDNEKETLIVMQQWKHKPQRKNRLVTILTGSSCH